MNYRRVVQFRFLTIVILTVSSMAFFAAESNTDNSGADMNSIDMYTPDCLRFDKKLSSWWQERQERIEQENKKKYVGEKPDTFKTGYYKHGDYIQFTFDQRGLFAGLSAGALFRFFYSLAVSGADYKTFKKAAIVPGIAKSFLFWIPCQAAYHIIVKGKDHEAFLSKVKDRILNEEAAHKMQDCLKRNNPNDPFSGL